MYFLLQFNSKPIATVDVPRVYTDFLNAVADAWPLVRRNEAEALIYKVDFGFTPEQKVLVARLNWEGAP